MLKLCGNKVWWPALGSIPGSAWHLRVPLAFVLDLCGYSGTSNIFACVGVVGGSVMNWHTVTWCKCNSVFASRQTG